MNAVSQEAKRHGVALIGSRGIPPRYGGAETFVYELARRLKNIFDVYVVCETSSFRLDEYQGIKRVHVAAYHTSTMTVPSIYDFISTLYLIAKAKNARIFYYVAPDGALAAFFARIARKRVLINTDGLEWKRLLIRAKFVPFYIKPIYYLTALYMLIMEFLACKISHVVIADSITIRKYLQDRWGAKNAVYIAYGIRRLPTMSDEESKKILRKMGLEPYSYYLIIGRMVAENNLHMVMRAIKASATRKRLVIVGSLNLRDPYVKYLIRLRGNDERILFAGPIYNVKVLSALRKYCYAYVHPYTVGGTNPSLLEQLQFERPIIAYNAPFHKEILLSEGKYFTTLNELINLIDYINLQTFKSFLFIKKWTWDSIYSRYLQLFKLLLVK